MKDTIKTVGIIIFTAAILLGGQSFAAKPDKKVKEHSPNIPTLDVTRSDVKPEELDFDSIPTMSKKVSATSTVDIPKFKARFHQVDVKGQGTCDIYPDTDGDGFTYVTYNNGVQTLSSTNCE